MPAMPTCGYLEEAALFVVAVDFVPVEVLVELPDAVAAAAPDEVAPVAEGAALDFPTQLMSDPVKMVNVPD